MNMMNKEADEKILNGTSAAGLIEYQEQSVVSRTLIARPNGTVTLFAFGAGQGLSEHSAPYDALAQVLDGVAEITVSGVLHRLAAGELILMPANEPHALYAPQKFKMMLTMVRS